MLVESAEDGMLNGLPLGWLGRSVLRTYGGSRIARHERSFVRRK
jgi:hypothetical protein